MMEDSFSKVYPWSFQTDMIFFRLVFRGVERHHVTRSDALRKGPGSNPNVRLPGPTQACRRFLSSLGADPSIVP